MEKIRLYIDEREVLTDPSQTVLRAALENSIDIPYLCYHPDIEDGNHHCGMCVVEVNGAEELRRACAVPVEEGMRVVTDSERIRKERAKNLEVVLEKHLLECGDCVWFQHCKLLDLTRKFSLLPKSNKDETAKVLQSGTIVFDQTKCIGCENCTKVCPTGFLEMNEHGRLQPTADETKECINCGQCIVHCPVGAIEGEGEFEELERFLLDPARIVVVQFAPSIRTSIGDEFGMAPGEVATGQLVAGLKKLGFNYVFDTAVAADFTTMEESGEVIERLQSGERLPAMSSCCPAWVKFLEFNYPEFVPNLCTSRSPQIMFGGIIKTHFAEKMGIDPDMITVVSIMPCVAKKYEIKREELKIDGRYPVDKVLTTRELIRLLKKNQIDLKTVGTAEADDPLGSPSGAGVIYGASGGVFESAFRTAYFKLTGEELPDHAIEEIRGEEGVKRKEIQVGDRTVRICVVNGVKNARTVLEELKADPSRYDAVEVMACPGGCVGGGGQPLPTNKHVVRERAKSLYTIDAGKPMRRAHENPAVKKVYKEFFTSEAMRKRVLHTHFAPRQRSEIRELKDSKETII